MRGADLPQQDLALRVEAHERLLALTMVDGDGRPVQVWADAGGECFGHGLLRGPAGGQVLVRILDRKAVVAFLRGEDPLQKTLPMAFDHAADAFDLDQVAAEAEQNAAGREGKVHEEVVSSG